METEQNKSKRSTKKIGIIALLILAFVAGFAFRGLFIKPAEEAQSQTDGTPETTSWICAMHAQIRQDEPGICPICEMELVPAQSGNLGPRIVEFTEDTKKLMQIAVTSVERKFVEAEIRLVGKIDYDETRIKNITAWTPGRIDRLYVDYTGIRVNEGDHMVYLYSPQLLSAQAELLQAVKAVANIRTTNGSQLINKSILATLDAAREKLRLLGLNKTQITAIEESGKPVDHLTIHAPIGGIVIEKNVSEGVYVDTGTKIYTVADLSKLWVKLDAYESDMMWIRYGQPIEFTTEAYPGEIFEGTISFIDPFLDAKTRTVKLRVNVDNTDGKLKPEMFVRAVVRPKVAASGRVMDASLAGKYICSMHPDIVKDAPGPCDICGMDLVTAESLGFVTVEDSQPPLVIPASAPLITGTRAVVYVQLPNKEKPTYQGTEIVLGPRAGDYYIVESGLEEGQLVVTRGNFKIDSALQIQAKPSMMSADDSPAPAKAEVFDVSEEFKAQIDELLKQYFAMQSALANDNGPQASASAAEAVKAIAAVDTADLTAKARNAWSSYELALIAHLEIAAAADITKTRKQFEHISDMLTVAIKSFGTIEGRSVYVYFCPMAFDNKGAHWLQSDDKTRNPYFGSEMLKCGDVIETISAK
jgi:Cu(I)/Ag(I) efflux system membrane fusion protein